MSKAQKKFDYVMREWKAGRLRSSSGKLVKYPSGRKQALAIAYGKAKDIDPSYGMKKGGGEVGEWKLENLNDGYVVKFEKLEKVGGSTMASGGGVPQTYSPYADGGVLSERKKIENQINIMKAAIDSPDTPESVRKSMEQKLSELEQKLSPIEIEKEIRIPEQETPKQEEKEEKKEVKGPFKARLKGKIEGNFEGIIEAEGGEPVKLKGEVSVETNPEKKQLWVDIEEEYKGIMRNVLYKKGIKYTSKMVNGVFRVYVDSKNKLNEIVDLYNAKRVKNKDKPLDASKMTGQYGKGGKLWIQEAIKSKGSLRRKAMEMGLIRSGKELT